MSWKDIFRKRAEEWIYAPLNDEQVPEDPKGSSPVGVNDGYLNITLRSMRIVNVRRFTSKFYGVVHSHVSLGHLSGEDAVFQNVTTPSELKKIDPKNLDRIIAVNMPIVEQVPYRGGNVKLEMGLFSVKETDLAGPFIDLLESMARQAGVGVVSAAIPFVQPLKKGIDAIIGTDSDTILEIGVSTNFDPPKTGWFVVMRAPKESNIVPSLSVTPHDFRLVVKTDGQPLKDYPYMVFTISHSRQRNDWFKLPYLKETYQKIREALREGKYTDAEDQIVIFRRAALTSGDLLSEDANRIVGLVEEEVRKVMGKTTTSAIKESAILLPELESFPLYQ